MGSLNTIRNAVRQARRERNLPHYAYQPYDKPHTEIIQRQLTIESNRYLHAGFQTLKDNPERFGSSDDHGNANDAALKQKLAKKKKKQALLVNMILNKDKFIDDDFEDDQDFDENHRIPWKGPKLTDPAAVQNLAVIIPTLRSKNVVFDHGKTPLGKKSDENFFNWLEEYSRLEHKKKREFDMKAFIPS